MFTFTNPVKKHIKRLSDFVLAIFIGVVTLPLLLFVIVLVKLDGGPAFYTQMRVGYLGKEFRIVKFRTMKKDAEKNGVQWCEKNDKRVTKVGRILRDYRIDEIPQIINVIRGEMSFIGPRPERPYFVRNLLEDIPQYSIRHCMRPGLSGWAQVNYDYGSSIEDSKKKLEYDLYYVKYSSFFLDLVILVKTLKIILQRKGQ
jgi:lipopolysaccharide/colanic/teichoic acid biosynthesis glycosyltransferase